MSTYNRVFTFNAGRSRSGLASVRYSTDAGVTWLTTGVTEPIAGTGGYQVTLTLNTTFQGAVAWDTGDGATVSSLLTLVTPGSGITNGSYTDGTFTGGGGSGATFSYTVSGGVVQSTLTLTNPGTGYGSAPTPVFGSHGGTPGTATASLVVPRGASEAVNQVVASQVTGNVAGSVNSVVTGVVAALPDPEAGITFTQSQALILAALTGASSGLDTGAVVFKAPDGTVRVSGTSDGFGNRSAITLNPPV